MKRLLHIHIYLCKYVYLHCACRIKFDEKKNSFDIENILQHTRKITQNFKIIILNKISDEKEFQK